MSEVLVFPRIEWLDRNQQGKFKMRGRYQPFLSSLLYSGSLAIEFAEDRIFPKTVIFRKFLDASCFSDILKCV